MTLKKFSGTISGLSWCFGILSCLSNQCPWVRIIGPAIYVQIVLKYALEFKVLFLLLLRLGVYKVGRLIWETFRKKITATRAKPKTITKRRRSLHQIESIEVVVYNHVIQVMLLLYFEIWTKDLKKVEMTSLTASRIP